MKKLFAALAVAGLTVAAFAQTPAPAPAPSLTFSGYFNTGVDVLANGNDLAVAGLWGQDAGKLGGRFNLNGKFVTAEGLSGINFQIRSENWGGSTNGGVGVDQSAGGGGKGATSFIGSTYLKSAYVWAYFANKLLYSQVGLINEQSARSNGDIAQSYTKEIPGAVLNVLPLEGLVLQAAVGLPVVAGKNDTLTPAQVTNVNSLTTILGGAYTVPGTVKVQAQAKLFKTDVAVDSKKYTLGSALFNASLLSVPNLKFVFESEFTGLGTEAKKNKSILSQTIDYGFKDFDLEPLHAGLIAYEFLHGADLLTNGTDKQGLGLKFNPWVSYKLDGGITPKLGLTYFSGPEVAENDASYTYNTYILNAAGPKVGSDLNKVAYFEIKPSVKLDLGPTQAVTFAYAYATSVGSDDVTFLSADTKSKSLQTLQIEYLYTF